MKEFGPPGGARVPGAPLDLPMPWVWGENLLFGKIFVENYMKIKEIGPPSPGSAKVKIIFLWCNSFSKNYKLSPHVISEVPQTSFSQPGFHGVMVSTQDSESCDPSSNLGGTWIFGKLLKIYELLLIIQRGKKRIIVGQRKVWLHVLCQNDAPIKQWKTARNLI